MSLKLCIRGLPPATDPRDIAGDLRKRGFTPMDIHYIKPRDDAPVKHTKFFVKLQMSSSASKVFEIQNVLGKTVVVEAWRKKGPKQCEKCQGFWHSSDVCHRGIKCQHCAGPHQVRQCIRIRATPTCANCNGPHAADESICPVYRREERNMKPTIPRSSGYTLSTPNVVEDSTAPNSLMAEANEKFIETPKRIKKRGRRNRNKHYDSETESTTSSEQFQQSQQAELISTVTLKKDIKPTDNISTKTVAPVKNEESVSQFPKLQELAHQKVPAIKENNVPTNNVPEIPVNAITKEKNTPNAFITKDNVDNNRNIDAFRTKVISDCISILQDVLIAIQENKSPIPAISKGLADLMIYRELKYLPNSEHS